MIKKLPIKYTTMAIYVDEHIFDKDKHVQEIVYDYILHISFMLIIKHKLFPNVKYSEQYAYYLASDVYMRMTTPRQFLPEDDPQYLTPIKSCLNYIKQLLYPRKVAFAQKEFGYTTKAEDVEAFNVSKDYTEMSVKSYNASMRKVDVETYLSDAPKTLLHILNKSPYGDDKVMVHKLCVSVMVSFIRNMSFSKRQKERLARLNKPKLVQKMDALSKQYYSENTQSAPVTYDLEEEYYNVVAVYLQKFKKEIAKDIQEINEEYSLSDEVMEDIIMYNLSEILEERDN